MVRCGLSLYGIHPCEATRDRVDLRPAMSVHARIIDTHIVPVSEGVSYGYQYRSPGSVKICTLPIGYGDGLRRCLSGNIDFIMDGHYYPQVGAICMDQCMFEVDLRNRRRLTLDPQIGEHVIIVGEQGAAAITIDELAEKAGTVPDEITVGFGQRLARVYR
jgi:alanine racemase